ncbi:hypothetical protein P3S68_003417 [Capsicum galapagoense]
MVGLEFLDLSYNNISGIIPMSFVKLQYLKYFNVSDNQLYGEIPSAGPFKNISSQFFIYNEALCGSSRFSVQPCPTSSKHKSNRKKLLKRISYYELLQATDALSESNLIGSGSFKLLNAASSIAPEYGLDGLVSTKFDVYSYGVMLLETFTRRKPNEFEGDLSLKQWVSYSLPEAVMDVIDVNLVTPTANHLQKELDVVASIMKVALDCCVESPARRTNMKDVVGMLQKIKIQLLAC